MAKTRYAEGIERAAIRAALDELGVPNEDYPAPVANAVEILSNALATSEETKEVERRSAGDESA